MNEFIYSPGERLPPETRIEPKEAKAQLFDIKELMKAQVPFAHRVIALPFYVDPNPRKMTSAEIANELDTTEGVINRIAQKVDAPTIIDEEAVLRYDTYSLEVIQEEIEWQAGYDELPDMVPATRIAEYLGRSWMWVEKYATQLKIYPVPTMVNGREYLLYPKKAVQKLYKFQLQIPPANDAYSIGELMEMIGKDHRWIKRILKEKNISSILRSNLITHEIAAHYPQEALEVLQAAKEALPPPAGNWLTRHDLRQALGKSFRWLDARLAAYEDKAAYRLTIASRVELHYPPEVLEALKLEVEETAKEQGWYSASEIATLAGKSIFWTRARTKPYASLAKYFPLEHQHNRPAAHYSEQVKDEIVTMARAEPPEAEEKITVEEIAAMLQRRRQWVIERIAQLGIESELRLDRRMKPRQHYDPETIDSLQLRFMIDEENEEV